MKCLSMFPLEFQVDWVTMNFVPFAEKSMEIVVDLYRMTAKHPSCIQSRVLQSIIQVSASLTGVCLSAHHPGVEEAGWIVGGRSRFGSQYTFTAFRPSDGKEGKEVFEHPVAHVRVGSARKKHLAAHGVVDPLKV